MNCWRVRRWFWRIIIATAVVVGVWAQYRWRFLGYASQGEYWLHQCRTYTAPPAQVVYEEDVVAARALLTASENYQEFDSQGCRDYFYFVGHQPSFWRRRFQAYHRDPIIFLHERTGPKGLCRVVVVEALQWVNKGGPTPALGLCWCTDLKTGDEAFNMLPQKVGLEMPMRAGKRRFFAGQPDPSDESHFTIGYEIDNQPGTVDGWLLADGQVKLQFRDGPATKP